MRGKPHSLNSKADYYYIKENFEPDYWKPLWQNMYDLRMEWMPGELLERKEDGIVDETHRVVEIKNDMGGEEGKVTYQQETYEENPYSDFVRMGFTVEEVEAALAE
jgi:hypothetical protein